jgi:cell wall assembly regulator SMI1
MKTIWDRIHTWLAFHAPAVLASLRPGASERQVRAAEEAMQVTLPDDVRACYRIHDGQDPAANGWRPPFLHGWGWLPLEDVVAQWRHWQGEGTIDDPARELLAGSFTEWLEEFAAVYEVAAAYGVRLVEPWEWTGG